MRRTKETAQFIAQNKVNIERVEEDGTHLQYEWIQMRPLAWHHLDELFAGDCDGMTYEEIEEKFPLEFERRKVDKLAYRYPRGESYLDVIARLEPMIIEMERHREPLLIVSHQGILRVIYAFYMGLSRAEAPYVSIPLNTVVELAPTAARCKEARHLIYVPVKALASDGQDDPHATNSDPNSH
jgi:broad specificity phosphatase PhoE